MFIFPLQTDTLQTRTQVLLEKIKTTSPDVLFQDFFHEILKFGLKVIAALLLYLIGAWIIRKIRKAVTRALEKRKSEATLVSFINSMVGIILWVLLIIMMISTLGVNTTSVAALLAAGGMAIGVALGGTVQNFAGGLMLLIFKPFKAGDFIEAQGHAGIVTSINLVSTKIITRDNRAVTIPNGALANGNINNFNSMPLRRVDLEVAVSYSSSCPEVKKVLMEVVSADSRILDSSTPGASDPFVALLAMKDSCVTFAVRVWVLSQDYWDVYFSLNEAIFTTLPEKGISFPFPQLDVHVKS